ncbi:MAG: potassium/proton antiporter [Hamadaea sp.]|uniref:potassium/proton antiporter n=1 Tax=Hamadaea sp. TaxID=2024425 RepID=UPI001804FEEB|nr:potassium/proton antiporter [Hamadaea sp.]NUT21649.1 potassium/proton antiporter [Hamadaea sp.]
MSGAYSFEVALLIGAGVLLAAVAAVRFSSRIGVPSLLVYLALGMLIGESGFGIDFENAALTRTLGLCALVLIIAEGGLSARWSTLKPVLPAAIALSTVGVFISTAVVGIVVHLLLGLSLHEGLLLGAVLSSTDAAAVFATLRWLRLKPKLMATLEAESGMNDAPAVILVVLLATPSLAGVHRTTEAGLIAYELIMGAALGLLVGLAGAWTLRRAALPAAGLYPLAAVGLTVLAYAAGVVVHASGFLAVYVAGVILGNSRLPHRQAILGFADGLAWLAQIGLFVLLGLLVSPARLTDALVPALVIGLTLLLLARPISVAVSLWPFRQRRRGFQRRVIPDDAASSGGKTAISRMTRRGARFGRRDLAFLSWAGLRGAVPIVLATIPLSEAVPGATALFDAVFVLVVIFTLAQTGTLAPVARWLRVTSPAEPTELRVETAPLERMRADLLQLEIPVGSQLNGVHLDELRLPVGAVVTLVLRDGTGFVPHEQTRLRAGDSMLIVATDEVRDATLRRLREVGKAGRLARWIAGNSGKTDD